MASKLSEKLRYAWSDDYESLQQFVNNDLNLEFDHNLVGAEKFLRLITLLWKERNNFPCLIGDRTNDIMQKL